MQRFISHQQLARDARFKRSSSRNELFRSLPDDVDAVVRVLEQIAPKIRQRVEGTALEPVFDDLGPGFAFLTNAGAQSEVERTPLQLRLQLHGIFVGELQALEAASRTLWDFPDGTLCYRERGAFLISEALGWQLVPPTTLKEGPRGLGSVQFFIDHDPNLHYFEFDESMLPQLARSSMLIVSPVTALRATSAPSLSCR